MNRLALRLLLVLAAAAGPAAHAALPVVLGEPVAESPKAAAVAGLLTTEDEFPAPRLLLRAPGEGELAAMDEAPGGAKKVKVGFGREIAAEAEAGTATAFAWSRVGEWRIAKLRVQSPGASALRVALRIAPTAEPWSLRVAGSDDETKALGPVAEAGPLGRTDLFWTPLTEGDAQVIEIASPVSQPAPDVQVVRVSHLVTGPSSGFKVTPKIGQSLPCNIDVACVANPSQALLNAAASVVRMQFTYPDGGSFLCSGTLLNDTASGTQIPYLFSANHCFEADSAPYFTAAQKQQVASTLNSYFFYQAATCGSLATPAFVQRFGGATFLYSSLSLDVLFVRLNDWAPAGAFLSGWDANAITAGSAITVLHHPFGDLKKFSSGTMRAFEVLPSPQNASGGYARVEYNQGVTEPGSSGGGLLTFSGGQYVLRGGLFGGDFFSCSSKQSNGYYVGSDFYSRFDAAYPSLRTWLEATGTPDFDVTDLWYLPSESGWGMNLVQHPSGKVFAVWYTYDTDFGPLWLVMPDSTWTTSRTLTGTLYRVSGPNYNQAFNAGNVVASPVGSLTFTFTDANNGAFTWTVNGVSGTKSITRQPF